MQNVIGLRILDCACKQKITLIMSAAKPSLQHHSETIHQQRDDTHKAKTGDASQNDLSREEEETQSFGDVEKFKESFTSNHSPKATHTNTYEVVKIPGSEQCANITAEEGSCDNTLKAGEEVLLALSGTMVAKGKLVYPREGEDGPLSHMVHGNPLELDDGYGKNLVAVYKVVIADGKRTIPYPWELGREEPFGKGSGEQ